MTPKRAVLDAAEKSRADAGLTQGTDQAIAYETGFEAAADWRLRECEVVRGMAEAISNYHAALTSDVSPEVLGARRLALWAALAAYDVAAKGEL